MSCDMHYQEKEELCMLSVFKRIREEKYMVLQKATFTDGIGRYI